MRQQGATLVGILTALQITPRDLIPLLADVDGSPELARQEEVTAATDLLALGEEPWQLVAGGFSLSSIASAQGCSVAEVKELVTDFVDLPDE